MALPKPKRIIGLMLVVVAGALAFPWLREFVAVDDCLDGGGSYDYLTKTCSFQINHVFAPNEIYSWLALGGVAVGCVGICVLAWSCVDRRKINAI